LVRHVTTTGTSVALALATVVAWAIGPAYLLRLAPLGPMLLATGVLWSLERVLRIVRTVWKGLASLLRRAVGALLLIAIAVARPLHSGAAQLYRWATTSPPSTSAPWAPGLALFRGLVAALASPVLDLELPGGTRRPIPPLPPVEQVAQHVSQGRWAHTRQGI
jgi:hypothetical protein